MSLDLRDLRGKRALVLGLGVHGGGAGVARFLAERGARVTVTDLRPPENLADGLRALDGLPVAYALGEHRESDITSAELIVRNPGVPRESPWLRLAREHGVPVVMEMNLFWAHCPAPITAITGSKGKSTTTAWLGHVLRLGRPDTVVAGNIRVSTLDVLPTIRPDTPVVLEVSSFQLEAFAEGELAPRVACVTNLVPDHLDRYRDMGHYADAKREIVRYQGPGDTAVLNRDDPVVSRFAEATRARVSWFGAREAPEGARLAGDRIVLTGDGERALVGVDDLLLPGRHNALNAAAVAALGAALGLPREQLAEGLRTFRGLADRMELVAEIDGVRYVNDTASTVPTSTVAALQGLRGGIVLIAGGASKRLGYGELADAVCARVRRLVLLEGTATDAVQTAVYTRCPRLETSRHGDLQSAVRAAAEASRPGETVLLSPACASFGMFENEFHRGELFRRAVRELAAAQEG